MWTSRRGNGSSSGGRMWTGGSKPYSFVDVIYGWPHISWIDKNVIVSRSWIDENKLLSNGSGISYKLSVVSNVHLSCAHVHEKSICLEVSFAHISYMSFQIQMSCGKMLQNRSFMHTRT